MCHATSAGWKAGKVSTNKSQFVDTLSTNKAYLYIISYVLNQDKYVLHMVNIDVPSHLSVYVGNTTQCSSNIK